MEENRLVVSKELVDLLSAVEPILENGGDVTVSIDHNYIRSVDSSHVAMCNLETALAPLTGYTLNLPTLRKLDGAIVTPKDNDSFIVSTEDFEWCLQSAQRSTPSLPGLRLPVKFSTSADKFYRALEEVAKYIKDNEDKKEDKIILFESKPNEAIRLLPKNIDKLKEYAIAKFSKLEGKEEYRSCFRLDYLLFAARKFVGELKVSFGKDNPMRIDFKEPFKGAYMLAPLIDEG